MNASNDTYLLSGNQPATRSVAVRLSQGLLNFRLALAERRSRAQQMEELYHSTDRELWDMGLSRGDLPEIAKGTYRRD